MGSKRRDWLCRSGRFGLCISYRQFLFAVIGVERCRYRALRFQSHLRWLGRNYRSDVSSVGLKYAYVHARSQLPRVEWSTRKQSPLFGTRFLQYVACVGGGGGRRPCRDSGRPPSPRSRLYRRSTHRSCCGQMMTIRSYSGSQLVFWEPPKAGGTTVRRPFKTVHAPVSKTE